MTKMYISGIKHDSIVDGQGLRNVIFVSGCWWSCKGCHNLSTHDPKHGKEMTIDEIIDDVYSDNNDITISGGDSLTYQLSRTIELLKKLKQIRPSVNIWLYTGYQWDELISDSNIVKALQYIDVLVDGRYVKSQKNEDLIFKGSFNQNIIMVQESLAVGHIVLWESPEIML